jgi:phosphatidylethanolamine/phosphatidyl-N-methylethanolamine N-methyltransferase
MNQRLADYRVFWRQFRQAYHTTGAALPSGRALAAALSHYVRANDPGEANIPRRILEVGPGTGAVTAQIVRDMRSDDRVVLVERNAEFVGRLRERLAADRAFANAGDRISIVHASVEELPDEPYDLIISGLPLNNFTAAVVEGILQKLRGLLATAGTLSFFEYVAIRRFKSAISGQADRQRVREIAEVLNAALMQHEIRRDCVWANVPPAWVHHVRF